MKKIKLLLVLFISIFIFTYKVDAAMSVNRSSVTEGESFTVTVGFTAASWNVHVNANGPVSGCSINEADSDSNAVDAYRSFSTTCTTTGQGTVTISLTGDYSTETGANPNLGETINVTVNAKPVQQPQPQPTYTYTPPTYYYTKSANNNLSSIGVEGATISPEFDSGTTEYEVLMPAGTTEINVLATKEDDRSTIAGDGKREVSDGPNSIEVIVTSESGLSKTYTLIVTVEEETLPVRFDGHDYTFIRKSNNLPSVSSYYGVTKTIYNDIEVPAYYSEVTNLTLVGLKDTKGKSYLYIYDSQTHAFKKYDEINLGNIAVYTKTPNKKDMIEDLKETVLKINGYEYNAYQFNLDSNYYLVYGTNANTNNTGWFMYDSEENTLQRYNMSEVINLTKQRDKLFIAIKLLGTICILAIIFMIFMGKLLEKKEI